MEHNVWSFKTATRNGCSPRLYSYDPKQIPLGEFEALLDFKTWSKRIIAINCYFTKSGAGEKFVVTVYCNYQTGKYMVQGSTVDFSGCATNAVYRISVCKNDKGKIVLSKAELINPASHNNPAL
ncbi:MAG: hypothetical protein QM763_14625 [Agriterribacter sp.]